MAAPASPSSAFTADSRIAATSTILVADDDPVVRHLCRRALGHDGVTVLEAEDGEAALKLIENHSDIDLVITDLTMPRVGGQELAEVLSVFRPGLPVLAMSSAAHKLEPDRRLPVLAKPFSPSMLIAAAREMRMRATRIRIWSEEKRARAQELCRIAAALQLQSTGLPERVDLVAIAQEFHQVQNRQPRRTSVRSKRARTRAPEPPSQPNR
jgi:CheY-like chemotaxis protein